MKVTYTPGNMALIETAEGSKIAVKSICQVVKERDTAWLLEFAPSKLGNQLATKVSIENDTVTLVPNQQPAWLENVTNWESYDAFICKDKEILALRMCDGVNDTDAFDRFIIPATETSEMMFFDVGYSVDIVGYFLEEDENGIRLTFTVKGQEGSEVLFFNYETGLLMEEDLNG